MLSVNNLASVAELVDALDLGSSIARCGGSSPLTRTIPFLLRKNFHPGDENRNGAERFRARVSMTAFLSVISDACLDIKT